MDHHIIGHEVWINKSLTSFHPSAINGSLIIIDSNPLNSLRLYMAIIYGSAVSFPIRNDHLDFISTWENS